MTNYLFVTILPYMYAHTYMYLLNLDGAFVYDSTHVNSMLINWVHEILQQLHI